MSKITEYPSAQTIGGGDVLLLDGANGTRKITGQAAADGFGYMYCEIDKTSTFVLQKTGWYHCISTSKPASTSENTGTYPISSILNIRRDWSYQGSETHVVCITTPADKLVFKPILDVSGVLLIDKIRLYMDADDMLTYIDIHYNADQINMLTVDLMFPRLLSEPYGDRRLMCITPVQAPEEPNVRNEQIVIHEFKANSFIDGPDAWPLT